MCVCVCVCVFVSIYVCVCVCVCVCVWKNLVISGSLSPCMARPQVADGGTASNMVASCEYSYILNKQSRTADKGRSSILGVGRGADNSSP